MDNTLVREKMVEKEEAFIPAHSCSKKIRTMKGHCCRVVEKWTGQTCDYIMGQEIEDPSYFYLDVIERDELVKGNYAYEYDHRPSQREMEEDHLNCISKIALDCYEEEFGADGRRVFPHWNDPSPEECEHLMTEDKHGQGCSVR